MQKKTFIRLLVVGLLVFLAFIPSIVKKESLLNQITLILLYATLATGWNVLGGYTGQISLGHAAFFGLGALATRQLWIGGFPVIPSILVAGVVAVAFALIIGSPAFKLKGVYFTIGTLALAQILAITVGNVFPAIAALPVAELQAYDLVPRYYLFLILAVFSVGVTYFLVDSKLGLGMMAVKEDEDAAESVGINAFSHKLLALSISAFITGLAGGAFAFYHVSYYYNFPFTPVWSLDTLTMVFIGGEGTILGPIVGSVFFVMIKDFLIQNLGEYHLVVFGTLFILVVLFLPGGLMEGWDKLQGIFRRYSTRRKIQSSADQMETEEK